MKHILCSRKKLWISLFCLALATLLICQGTLLWARCNGIRENLLRLHVLAHSNSEKDQSLKLKVRDALLTYGRDLLGTNTTKEEAIATVEQNLSTLTQIAQNALKEEGCDLPVSCQIERTYFNTRVYGTVTLPAGEYTALRVVIGQGAGNNWWCVMFPPLCIPAAGEVSEQPGELEGVLTPGQQDLVENGLKYQVKFKTVEWFEQVKQWFN